MIDDMSREEIRVEIGARVAAARKAAGMSQVQLATALRIPQRTVSFYERGEGDLPSSLLVLLVDVLGVGTDELLGLDVSGSRKPGPKGMLQERLEAVRELPRQDQQYVVKFLDQALDDYARRRRNPPKASH